MSRKQRTPKQQVSELPSPAWVFMLLTGEDPGVRLPGWVTAAQAGRFGEPTADDIWTLHREALIAEASKHNFTPYWETSEAPAGPQFRAWCARFIQDHRY